MVPRVGLQVSSPQEMPCKTWVLTGRQEGSTAGVTGCGKSGKKMRLMHRLPKPNPHMPKHLGTSPEPPSCSDGLCCPMAAAAAPAAGWGDGMG